MVARACACTGWSWDTVVNELDLPRLQALNSYWDSHPPVHILVAAYMGIKPKQSSTTSFNQPISETSLDSLSEHFTFGEAPVYLTMDQYLAKKSETKNE